MAYRAALPHDPLAGQEVGDNDVHGIILADAVGGGVSFPKPPDDCTKHGTPLARPR